MGEPAEKVSEDQLDLDRRVDGLVAAHNGDWRAAMETLLIAADVRASKTSYGFVRGRLSDSW